MSIHLAAQHLMSKGRGPDDTLVHMSKGELQSLQQLAKAHGGTLTTNPETGLPEAGFLSNLLPTIIGGALVASGVGAPMAALMVGGGETLATGSLGKGLMAGLGAYGGAGLTEGLMGTGASAIGANAYTAEEAAKMAPEAAQNTVNNAISNASPMDKLTAGAKQFASNPMDTMTALGNGSTMKGAGMVAAATLPAMLGSAPAPTTKTYPVANALQYNANPQAIAPNAGVPAYGHQGQNFGAEQTYFKPSYTDTGVPFKPVGMAGGGQIDLHGTIDMGQGQFGGGYTPMGGGFGGQNPGFGGGNTAQIPQAPTGGISDAYNQGFGNMSANGGRGGYGGMGNNFFNGGQNPPPPDQVAQNNSLRVFGTDDQGNPITDPNALQQYLQQKQASSFNNPAQGGSDAVNNAWVPGPSPDVLPQYATRDDNQLYADGGSIDKSVRTPFAYDAPHQMVNQTFAQWLAAHPQTQSSSSTEKNYNQPALSGPNLVGPPAPASAVVSPAQPATQPALSGPNLVGPTAASTDSSQSSPASTGPISSVNTATGQFAPTTQTASPAQSTTSDMVGPAFADYSTQTNPFSVEKDYGIKPVTQLTQPKTEDPVKSIVAQTNPYDPGFDINEAPWANSGGAASGGLFHHGMIDHSAHSSLNGYSDGGRLLKGPGDGVSDSIPAVIGGKQPARLADGEFVVPARIVSELGNGSTEAGARKLYAMMDRIQKARSKTVGKGKVATNSRADKHLPA